MPVCTDLLTIGDGTVVRKDAFFACYRARAGVIETGPVRIGKDALVGEAAVLDIETSLGDGAQLGHSSSLHAGQAIPDGERWHGSPAQQRTEVDYRAVCPKRVGPLRKVAYVVVLLLTALLVTVPLIVGVVLIMAALVPQLGALLGLGSPAFPSWIFVGEALAFSFALFFGLMTIGLVVVMTVPRALNLAVRPDKVYPLYGVAYWAHRAIARITNNTFFHHLLGDSSYIVPYLRCLGYDLSEVEQTGSNFGLEVKHETPYLVSIGTGTMSADGLSIINADYSDTSFRVSRASIGAKSFLGNYVVYPSQARAGDDCLFATKVMVPVDGHLREGVGLLGSPDFEIPRSVERDRKFDHLARGDEFRRRLAAKNRHNAVTIGLFLLAGWIFFFELTVVARVATDLYASVGASAYAMAAVLALVLYVAHFVLVERLSTMFRPLQSRYCSIYDPYFWWHERYWKLAVQPVDPERHALQGPRLATLGGADRQGRLRRRLHHHGQDSGQHRGWLCAQRRKHHPAPLAGGPHLQVGPHRDRRRLHARDRRAGPLRRHDGRWRGTRPRLLPHEGRGCSTARPLGRKPGQGASRRTLRRGERREVPMRRQTETGREFWRARLVAGGFTAIPRWTLDRAAGVASHETTIPDDLAAALRRLAEELGAPLGSVLLAAHAKVLAALSGEREVVTGYVAAAGGPPLPCRLTTEPEPWRALLLDARQGESELLSHKDIAVDDLRRELGLTEPSFETVFDPTGEEGDLAEDTVLWVGIAQKDGPLVLRLRYRTEVIGADYAARIAGYHLAALALIAADPDAEHGRQSLLSAEELEYQLEGLAGPRRELPDRRFHELFEQRVRAHPDAVAAEHGDRRWTYRELNARANRLGRALLARGLNREGVVAVVTERNLDWMAAVLAIFKAGGVYLPIAPHFPADRIATMLQRAGCRLVLTERGSTTTLDQALDSLSGIRTLLVEAVSAEDHDDGDLGVGVAPDQLAYIYFTSGSTGEPKGAMCEHAGMLNHLYAKIEDLEIGEGQVVAQTAPQCFDISLWQLVSALLVGGRTVIIEQEVFLDIERFVDTIVARRVAVLQVVPSYLAVVVSYLEQHPRRLADLRCVSVTGEALTMELTRRWFAVKPEIRLVNAYGMTETCDDTNHEVMDRVPDRELVPLGSPINNVHVYVVDEHLSPVPLGAPGEIVFSGICVGRGYINDPDRTQLAFMTDPHREGQRLYRSGDQGRWLPNGKLEFLGRKDTQVKIRGFRIEIGEIENALLRVPSVRHAAVVVAGQVHERKRLVAFYSGRRLEIDVLRDRLGESLPEYMIPSAFHWREELPLNANGKIDRKALTALAGEAR